MPNVPGFYSIGGGNKPIPGASITTTAHSGREIEEDERRKGTGTYRLCDDCAQLKRQGR